MEERMLKDGGMCTVTVYPDYFHIIYYALEQCAVSSTYPSFSFLFLRR